MRLFFSLLHIIYLVGCTVCEKQRFKTKVDVASVLELNHKVLKEVDDLIFKFIWNGKRAKISRSILKKEIAKGGLNIPDFESIVKTSRHKWVVRIQTGTQGVLNINA